MTSAGQSPFDLTGKRILITGAAGGIGGATAQVCATQGAELVLLDIADEAAVRARVGRLAPETKIHQIDTTDRGAIETLARQTAPIHGIVDTAAICPEVGWLDEGWDAVLDRTLDVNIRGPINLTRAFFPGMVSRGQGRIVLCGSVAGWMGGIRSGPHYAFTKGGMHAFIRWLAHQGAPHNVLVNGLAPGATDTAMVRGKGYDESQYPMKRMARPEEIAAAAAFLLSPGASYASGAILDINGGIFFH